ncbi:hypothetical protein ABZS29_02590 [Kribbella sp. NPDC005582]|uniref:hypothetical protein n=1 Tax=Kribbella sp. NPDC005582 TaxID=3156893 RepID=UPI00339F3DB0
MPTMGDLTVDAWDAEYRRTGRVVFPRRSRSLLVREVLFAWLIVILPGIGTVNDLDTRGTWFYVRVVFLVILFIAAVSTTLKVLRGGPVLTVDTSGIRLGKQFTPWSAIGSIGTPASSFRGDHLSIPLTDDDDELDIPRDNVDDLPSLAAWLTHLQQLGGRIPHVEPNHQPSVERPSDPLQ